MEILNTFLPILVVLLASVEIISSEDDADLSDEAILMHFKKLNSFGPSRMKAKRQILERNDPTKLPPGSNPLEDLILHEDKNGFSGSQQRVKRQYPDPYRRYPLPVPISGRGLALGERGISGPGFNRALGARGFGKAVLRRGGSGGRGFGSRGFGGKGFGGRGTGGRAGGRG